ncbi:MAG: serine/threonine-protein kinase [Planctomycetota bacterium]
MADRDPDPKVPDDGDRRDSEPTAPLGSTPTPIGEDDKTIDSTHRVSESAATEGELPTEFGEEICPLEPGARCGGRYRILEKVGAGGMGEVWRARDEALKQVVALKFLGGEYLRNQREGLEILRNEVRLAWRVSHPNVCRVHDIGEVGGRTFLSMEFIDGESLDRLLTRIGRPSPEKCREIARQLVAGVQAAHQQGVLHRDLKPGNIMLDSRGEVRITDFGIAGDLGEVTGTASGTPAYMAPELFRGEQPSVQTDLYSLGLILFELFTGERAFRASSLEELIEKHRRSLPLPSDRVANIDPAIESLILDCIAKDPADRPESAFEVLSRLSGSNLLNEMVQAGQTPSPEMVAGADSKDRHHAKISTLVLGVFLLCMTGLFWLESEVKLASYAWLPENGQVLAADGRRHLDDLGFSSGEDQAWGFDVNSPYIRLIFDREYRDEMLLGVGQSPFEGPGDFARRDFDAPGRFRILSEENTLGSAIDFWFRTSPEPMKGGGLSGIVSWSDPPLDVPGMTRARLAPDGALRAFDRVSPLVVEMIGGRIELPAESESTADELSESKLFEVIQLPRENFEPIEPMIRPVVFADRTKAWQSTDGKIRVEAGFLDDEVVSVRVFETELRALALHQPDRPRPAGGATPLSIFRAIFSIAAAFLAWRTVRRGGGDRAGAFRIGLSIFGLVVIYTLLTGHHPKGFVSSGDLLLSSMARGLLVSIQYGLFYFALEPYVRRVWPQMLVPWYRLLRGEWRDPAIGFSVLSGVAAASFVTLLVYLSRISRAWLGEPGSPPLIPRARTMEVLHGGSDSFGALLEVVVSWTDVGMGIVLGLVCLKMLTKSKVWAVGLMMPILMGLWAIGFTGFDVVTVLSLILIAAAAIFLVVRVGMLALLVALCTFQAMTIFPFRSDLSHWLGTATMMGTAVLVASAVFGYVTSLHGRSSVRAATELRMVGLQRAIR